MIRPLLAATTALLLAACSQVAADEPNASPAPARGFTLSASDAAACQAGGGQVAVRGRLQAELCVQPFADAGKACTDNSQCEGACVSESMEAAAGETVTGQCQADNRPFGCFAELEQGRPVRGICID
jgi:putative hemolysin